MKILALFIYFYERKSSGHIASSRPIHGKRYRFHNHGQDPKPRSFISALGSSPSFHRRGSSESVWRGPEHGVEGTGGARQPGASTSHSVDHPWSPRGGVTGHKKGENAVKSRSSWRDRREPGACAVGRQREPGGGPGCKRTFPGSKMARPPHLNIFLKSRMQAHNGACGPIARHCGGAGSNGRAGPISISLMLFCVDPEQGLTVSNSVPLCLKCGGEFGLFLGSFSN